MHIQIYVTPIGGRNCYLVVAQSLHTVYLVLMFLLVWLPIGNTVWNQAKSNHNVPGLLSTSKLWIVFNYHSFIPLFETDRFPTVDIRLRTLRPDLYDVTSIPVNFAAYTKQNLFLAGPSVVTKSTAYTFQLTNEPMRVNNAPDWFKRWIIFSSFELLVLLGCAASCALLRFFIIPNIVWEEEVSPTYK